MITSSSSNSISEAKLLNTSNSLEKLASQLIKVNTDLRSRTESFRSTVVSVESGWKTYKTSQSGLIGVTIPDSTAMNALYNHVASP